MRRAILFCVGFAIFSIMPSVARAQGDDEASRRFHEGEKAFDAHDYRRAAESFEDADRAKHAGAALLSAAIAWEFTGDLVRAAGDYDAAISAHDLADKQADDARRRLATVDAKLAHLEVRGEANVFVALDRNPAFVQLPTHVRLMPGDHTLEIHFPDGRVEHRDIHVDIGDDVIEARARVAPIDYKSPESDPHTSNGTTQRTIGWIGIGVGGAAIVGGVIVGAIGLGARNSFEDGGDVDASLHDRAIAFRTAADVLLIGGACVAGAGAVLFLTAPKDGPSVTVGATSIRFSTAF